ncbi:hypothetical protein L0128_12575 [candidate division KSB1 bacterium]|nr:hypothetical protein [candidate division KSB1 bacterium]
MQRTKLFWIFLTTLIVGSFLFMGCYTQLERADVEVADDYSQDDDEYYESYADSMVDDASVTENNYYNYYLNTDPYRRLAYPFYYRPLSRYDALLFFDSYDPWLNYYGWWPYASSSVYWVYDPWYYRYHYNGPDWWDNYYLPDGNYSYRPGVKQQRPFGQRHFSNLDFPSPTVKQRLLTASLEEPRARIRPGYTQGTNTMSKERRSISSDIRRTGKATTTPSRMRYTPAKNASSATERTKRSSAWKPDQGEKKRSSTPTYRNNDSSSKRSNRSTPAPSYTPNRASTKSSNSGSSAGSNSGSGSKSSSGSGSKSSSGSSGSSGSSSGSKSSSKQK